MIWRDNGVIELEDGEPRMRSCWKCNAAHEHLKKVNSLHVCFFCGQYWIFDKYIEDLKSDNDFDAFFKEKGLTPGGSTQGIDAGYRLAVIEFGPTGSSIEGE